VQLPQLSFLYEKGQFYWGLIPGYWGFNICQCDEGVEVSSWNSYLRGSDLRYVIDKEGEFEVDKENYR